MLKIKNNKIEALQIVNEYVYESYSFERFEATERTLIGKNGIKRIKLKPEPKPKFKDFGKKLFKVNGRDMVILYKFSLHI